MYVNIMNQAVIICMDLNEYIACIVRDDVR